MREVRFCFRILCIAATVWLFVSCNRSFDTQPDSRFTFAVLDVWQGLSQIGVSDGAAVVFDMADSNKYALWQKGYAQLGSPDIRAIAISHSDMDHKGGLYYLPSAACFSGLIVVSAYEDTAALRAFSVNWSSNIRFKVMLPGDTLAAIDDVYIECLWPPDSAELGSDFISQADRNRLSLCFRITHSNTSAFITGDIDSISTKWLSQKYGYALHSDIVVVPHHGSKSSVDAVFYGYIAPQAAIISCGLGNTYGHPSKEVLRLLTMQMQVDVYDTRLDGNIVARSNGNYWVWDE